MKFNWNKDKDDWLKAERGICFEDIVVAFEDERVLERDNNSSRPHQFIYYVEIKSYVYAVPVVHEEDGTIFFKTIYASRKFTKKYLNK